MKRLPTKWPAGQRSLDELFSAPAKRVTPPLQESTTNARDLEFTLKKLPLKLWFWNKLFRLSSTTGTELEGWSRAKSYDVGEALASEEVSG